MTRVQLSHEESEHARGETNLSKLVDQLETGREDEIVVARNGRPVARLTVLDPDRFVPTRIVVARSAWSRRA